MTGVASRTASHVQVALGSSEEGIVHDVQPRSAICSSQSSFAMLPSAVRNHQREEEGDAIRQA